MEERKGFLTTVLYLIVSSTATSTFFAVLLLLNSLRIPIIYYQPRVLEATFLSRQIDLYILLFSTLVTLFALAGLTVAYSEKDPIEYLPISALAVGVILLISGAATPGTILIIIGQMLALVMKTIYRAGSHHHFSKRRIQTLVTVYLLSLTLLIELSALIYWTISGFNPSSTLGRGAAILQINLTYASSSASTWIYIAFLFSWLWALPILLLRKWLASKHTRSAVIPDTSRTSILDEGASILFSIGLPVLLLLGLSILVGYYPYWHEPDWLVGTDVYWRYKEPLDRMASMSGLAGFGQALEERHPAFLIILFGSMKLTGASSHEVLQYTPLALTVMTAIATFWLAHTLGFGNVGSTLAGLVSIMWVPTTIGIFTSILANWFALILWIVFLAILMDGASKIEIIGSTLLAALLSLAILFIHPWSWGPLAAVTALYLLTRFLGRKFSRRELVLCATFDLAGLVAGYLSLVMLQASQGWRITEALDLYTRALFNPKLTLAFAEAVRYFTNTWSPFLDPALIALGVLGMFVSVNLGGKLNRLIFSWLCVMSIASILATPVGAGAELWRVFFIGPSALLTAIGASHLYRTVERKLCEGEYLRMPSTQLYWAVGVIFSALASSIIMSAVLLELAPLAGLFLNLLLVTLSFHVAYRGVGISLLLGVAIVVLIANSGLATIAPLIADPHNISLR